MDTARFHLNSQRELLEAKAGKIQHLTILKDEVQGLKMSMAKTKERMFSRDEATDFLKLLNQVIERTGSVLIAMLPRNEESLMPNAIAIKSSEEKQEASEVDGSSVYTQMPVQIAVRGEYSEIMSFFEQLKKRKQLIDIGELSMATAAENPAEVDARLTLILYIYENQEI